MQKETAEASRLVLGLDRGVSLESRGFPRLPLGKGNVGNGGGDGKGIVGNGGDDGKGKKKGGKGR